SWGWSSGEVGADRRPDGIRVLVDLVQAVYRFSLLVLLGVEHAEVLLLLAVEVQSSNRSAVVVVEEDREVGLRVALSHSTGLHLAAGDGLDDVVRLELLECCLDARVSIEVLVADLLAGRGVIDLLVARRRVRRGAQGGLESIIDLVAEELFRGLGDQWCELLSDTL